MLRLMDLRLLVAAIALAAGAPAASQRLLTHSVSEYGLSVALPEGAQRCRDHNGDHLHGWGVAITGDCSVSRRSIAVRANWNVLFQTSAADAAFCSTDDVAAASGLKLAFNGHRSTACLQRRAVGDLHITVAAQAWRWPDAGSDPDLQTPWVNYFAHLTTTPDHLNEDLTFFRRVLAGVQIGPPSQ